MHILNPPNIGALVNVNPDFEWAGEHIAHQVEFVPFAAKVEGLVRICDGEIDNLAQFALDPDRPRIRYHLGQGLLRVMNHQVTNDRVGFERDQGLALRLSPARHCQQHGANRLFAVRHSSGRPAQRDARRNGQGSIQPVKAGGKVADRALSPGRLQCCLNCFGVVCDAITLGAVLAGVYPVNQRP